MGACIIQYIYFDVDNNQIVESLEDLQKIYFKGIRKVFEHIYPHHESGQVLNAMSSSDETEISLRIKLNAIQVER